jgi:hypothetical protein
METSQKKKFPARHQSTATESNPQPTAHGDGREGSELVQDGHLRFGMFATAR